MQKKNVASQMKPFSICSKKSVVLNNEYVHIVYCLIVLLFTNCCVFKYSNNPHTTCKILRLKYRCAQPNTYMGNLLLAFILY